MDKTFKCITRSGRELDVKYGSNDNVMVALYDYFSKDPWGTCGGSCVCATCHVEVLEGMPPGGPDENELYLVEFASGYKEGSSRLGCQIDLRDVPDKTLVVKVNHID